MIKSKPWSSYHVDGMAPPPPRPSATYVLEFLFVCFCLAVFIFLVFFPLSLFSQNTNCVLRFLSPFLIFLKCLAFGGRWWKSRTQGWMAHFQITLSNVLKFYISQLLPFLFINVSLFLGDSQHKQHLHKSFCFQKLAYIYFIIYIMYCAYKWLFCFCFNIFS